MAPTSISGVSSDETCLVRRTGLTPNFNLLESTFSGKFQRISRILATHGYHTLIDIKLTRDICRVLERETATRQQSDISDKRSR